MTASQQRRAQLITRVARARPELYTHLTKRDDRIKAPHYPLGPGPPGVCERAAGDGGRPRRCVRNRGRVIGRIDI